VKVFEFDPAIKTINDLRIGMELPGIITNITNFGAFVDVGIKENGLVHISNMSDKFISNPAEVVSSAPACKSKGAGGGFVKKKGATETAVRI